MQETDGQQIVAWRNQQADRICYLNWQPLELEQHVEWFRNQGENSINYMMVRRSDHVVIGTLGFKNIDATRGIAQSSRLIGDVRSRGLKYGFESALHWLSFGFLSLGINRIKALVHRDNNANLALNRRLGYRTLLEAEAPRGFIWQTLGREEFRSAGLMTVPEQVQEVVPVCK
jgi:RimJ/RimL family protein N-acetyltransferase